jgi:hypothetical protein
VVWPSWRFAGWVLIPDKRGAYCAAVAISLLDLPLELSRDSPAWSREGDTLLTGLPEWIGRCKLSVCGKGYG